MKDSHPYQNEVDLTDEVNLVEAFTQAVNKAAPLTKIIYYRGNGIGGSALARQVRQSYAAGLVDMVQRRVRGEGTEGQFEYLAIRRGQRS